MAIFKFTLGNLKRRKSYSIIISLLVLLAGIILTVTVSTMKNSMDAFDQAYRNTKGPHLLYWLQPDSYKMEMKEWFEKQDEVETVKLKTAVFCNGAQMLKDNIQCKTMFDYFFFEYNPADNMRVIHSQYEPEKLLKPGEIYLPYIFKTTSEVNAGDNIEFVFGEQRKNFKVVGFVEELIAGGELNDTKFVYISQTDYKEILKLGEDKIDKLLQMRIRLKTDDETVCYQLAKEFMKAYGSEIDYVIEYSKIKNNLLVLPNVALAVMITFAIMLCAITITIMRYSILTTIEADYINIGIIKALGFTPLMVQLSITGQYILLALISGSISLLAGVFVTPIIGRIILESSGLFFDSHLSFLEGMLTLLILVVVISIFSFLTARQTKRISPIRAITNGLSPVYFSSRLNVPLERMKLLSFNSGLALKQILTKSKRYLLLIFISAILAYTLNFLLGLMETFQSEEAVGILGADFSDIEIDTATKADAEALITKIQADYEMDWYYFENSVQLEVNGEKIVANVRENFMVPGILKPLKGRFPRHDNEVALTSLLERRYHKHIGDYVTIKDENQKLREFIITGIFQTVDEGGSIVLINEAGMKALNSTFDMNEVYIKLKSHDNLDATIIKMQQNYSGYKEISNERKDQVETVHTVKDVFKALSMLVLVLSVIIISVITLLMMKITIYSETRELGIYRALGFSSLRLRYQLALRFALITVLGGAIGVILQTFTGAKLFSYVLRFAGISSFRIEFNFIFTLLPVIVITALAVLSSFLSSVNMKSISVNKLNIE